MAKLPTEFMEKYGVSSDEIWQVRPGTWAIKHGALERIAAEKKIKFDCPIMIEQCSEKKIAVMCVVGHFDGRSDWSIGEASPANNKNSYPFAMAEKRAKDRVILKLLQAPGGEVYSEAEADEFREPEAVADAWGTEQAKRLGNAPRTKPDDRGPPDFANGVVITPESNPSATMALLKKTYHVEVMDRIKHSTNAVELHAWYNSDEQRSARHKNLTVPQRAEVTDFCAARLRVLKAQK